MACRMLHQSHKLQGSDKILTRQISKQESLPGLGSGLGRPCLNSLHYSDQNLNHAHVQLCSLAAVSLHCSVTLAGSQASDRLRTYLQS